MVKPSALGDVVHALPVANLLKSRWPGCRLDWVVSRPFAPLLEAHPAVDAVVPFDRRRGQDVAEQFSGVKALAAQLRAGEYDLAIDLQGLFRSGWLTKSTRAPVRIGFAAAREFASVFYTHKVPDRGSNRHAIERNLDVAEVLGCGRGPIEFRLTTTPDDEATIDALLAPLEGQPFATLLPGTNWPTKRWPARHFAELARRLRHELGLEIVVAGASDAAEALPAFEESGVVFLDATSRTNVRELIALLRRAALVACNDSGPMHLAAALGRPLVAPFGPTDPRRTGPFGAAGGVLRLDLPCAPCFRRACIHQTCLQALGVDAVLATCARVLR